MYAHQVIDDLKKWKVRAKDQVDHLLGDVDKTINSILSSQKFHIGKFSDVSDTIQKKKGERAFWDGDCSFEIRMPYPICWFDYNHDIQDLKDQVKTRGMLVEEVKPDLLMVSVFNKIKHLAFDIDWHQNTLWFYVSVGKAFSSRSDGFSNKIMSDKSPFFHSNIYPIPTSDAFEEELIKLDPATFISLFQESSGDFEALNATLMFLNCKNIEYFENHPPEKLNKKRIKNKKTPLFTYKTLVLAPATKKQKSLENQGLWENRVHLCRGHFKTYTEANPLFGKYTGRYWWQPFARGNKEQGVVMKDYKVSGLSGAGGGAG